MVLYTPHILLFGFAGITLAPWLVLISSDHRANAELHAHEAVHAGQQRRDGVLTFWHRYITSKDWRYRYELEAYRVWLDTAPDDFWKVVSMMQNYGFNISQTELINALSRR